MSKIAIYFFTKADGHHKFTQDFKDAIKKLEECEKERINFTLEVEYGEINDEEK